MKIAENYTVGLVVLVVLLLAGLVATNVQVYFLRQDVSVLSSQLESDSSDLSSQITGVCDLVRKSEFDAC